MNEPLPYFAYGSNLHPARLQRRVPGAELVGAAELPRHALRFHKMGTDGSGKCDALSTGRPSDTVLGALFRLSPADLVRLDGFEGVGQGYLRATRRVVFEDEMLAATTYIAQPEFIDPKLRPFDWYRRLVLCGASYHSFPDWYIQAIRRVPEIPDPDPRRAQRMAGVLREMSCA